MEKLKALYKANKETIEGFAILTGILIGTYVWGNDRGYNNGYESGYRNGIRDICDMASEHSIMREK